jgi:ADP-heptose:LPS heptosyltransferase
MRCYSVDLSLSMKSLSCNAAAGVPAKICAMFPGALGDFICFLPALQALRQQGLVDLYARSEFSDLAPAGIAVRSIESAEIGRLFRCESLGCIEEVENHFDRYDAVYSWHGSGDPAFVRRLQTVTGGRAQCFQFRPKRVQGHQSDYYLRCVSPDSACLEPASISIRAEALQWRADFWATHSLQNRAVLAVAPGSGAREKNWPAEFFTRVVEWWHSATGGEVLLLVGPVEQERGGLGPLVGHCAVAEGLSLAQVAAALALSHVYLGNDSGISHLAGAIGVRTLALFGPSDPDQWAPRGNNVVVLRRDLACSPCDEATMKTCPHRACLREFSAQEVIDVITHLPEVVIFDKMRDRDYSLSR